MNAYEYHHVPKDDSETAQVGLEKDPVASQITEVPDPLEDLPEELIYQPELTEVE